MAPELKSIVRWFKAGDYIITKHGFNRMKEKSITVAILEEALGGDKPKIVEDYPQNRRGASCLILGWNGLNNPIHACIGYAGDRLEVITAYRPTLNKWYPDFSRRRKNGKT